MTSLPAGIFDLVEFTPVEILALHHLRARMPAGIEVNSLIADDQTFPLVLVRRTPDWGAWQGHPRFMDNAQLTIHAYCEGIEADTDCGYLSDAVRTILRDSVNVPVDGIGHFTEVEMTMSPRRASDWATSTGPVQYADLPTGVVRYETVYEVSLRSKRS